MLKKLFGSKSRIEILSLFFSNKNKEFYVQQVIRLAKVDSANTHRELKKLEDAKILKSKKKTNQKFYKLNKNYEYYNQLKDLFEKHNQKHGVEAWVIVEEMPNYYPQMTLIVWDIKSSNKVFSLIGLENKFSKLFLRYDNNMTGLALIKKELNKITIEIIEKFFEKPSLAKKYNDILHRNIENLEKVSSELDKTNFKALSNNQLALLYKKCYNIYKDLHRLHWIQTGLDFDDNLFSKFLLNYLKKNVLDKNDSIGDAFSILTIPTEESNAAIEYKNLLRILDDIEKDEKLKKYFKNTDIRIILKDLKNIAPDLNRKLDNHTQKFGYLGYNTVGPVWGKDYFTDILRSLLSQNLNANKLLDRIEKEKSRIEKRQNEIVKKYKIDKKYQELFKTARDMVFNKGARKDSMFRFYSVMEEFYKEFGRRYYLSVRQARYLLPEEILGVLKGEREIATQTLNERYKFSIYLSEDTKKDRFIIGDDAKKYLKNINLIQEDIENISFLQGDTASVGRIKGKVKIVNVTKDMDKMNKGDILVSIATTPDLVPAIKKASAIITDVGGIISHAAIVSREFNIPCVIGTRVATKVLKDNDLVDVDATHGKVKVIKKYKKR